MPYVARSVPQALDIIDPGVIDVFHSPSVYINNVETALWKAPVLGNGVLSSLNIPPPTPNSGAVTIAQQQNFKAAAEAADANGAIVTPIAGGGQGQPVSVNNPNAIPVNTTDPNDSVGKPETVTPQVQIADGSQWGALENKLNSCLEAAARGEWNEKTPLGAVAPNYVFNANIMNCYQACGFPKDVLDKIYPGPGKKQPGDRVPWCAAFAGAMMANCGIPYLKALNGVAYTTQWKCLRLPVSDPRSWRPNDFCYISGRPIESHAGFIRKIKDGYAYVTGGNTGNSVATIPVQLQNITFVGRAWKVPPEYDKPML